MNLFKKIWITVTELFLIRRTDNKILASTIEKVWGNSESKNEIICVIQNINCRESKNRFISTINQLESEIKTLNEKKDLIREYLREVTEIEMSGKYLILEGTFNKIEQLIESKSALNSFEFSLKDPQQLDDLFQKNNLLTQFRVREIKRKKEEEIKQLQEIELQQEELGKQRKRLLEKQIEAEKQCQTKKELSNLLIKKNNWIDFQQVLQQNGIRTLYHFTDQENIRSIKKQGGLFSWSYCDRHNIVISKPGGSMDSRNNDIVNKKIDYVRLAFTKEHPMCFVALKDGRISNLVWLEINPEVVFLQNTEFADKNAAAFSSYKASIGGEIEYLKNIRFDILKKAERVKHFGLDDAEKPFNQAEVLVKSWIPIEYIMNINDC